MTIAGSAEAGSAEPGQPLQEIALAQWLGTSRTPVRKAIRAIAANPKLTQVTNLVYPVVERVRTQGMRRWSPSGCKGAP